MLIYVLDAFNITRCGIVPDLERPDSEHLNLIYYVSEINLTGSHRNQAVIFFDGFKPDGFIKPCPRYQIRFSNQKSANEIIRNFVSTKAKINNLIVVTADREIRAFVVARGGKVKSSLDFLVSKKREDSNETEEKLDQKMKRQITKEFGEKWL